MFLLLTPDPLPTAKDDATPQVIFEEGKKFGLQATTSKVCALASGLIDQMEETCKYQLHLRDYANTAANFMHGVSYVPGNTPNNILKCLYDMSRRSSSAARQLQSDGVVSFRELYGHLLTRATWYALRATPSFPSALPSLLPSPIPSSTPSENPSDSGDKPSTLPSTLPTSNPSNDPSAMPSTMPSMDPSQSVRPSSSPSKIPSSLPSKNPSHEPSVSNEPSNKPSPSSGCGACSSTNPKACSPDGVTYYVPSDSSCAKFYQCNDANPPLLFLMNCPPGLIFDSTNCVCNWPTNANCSC